MKKVLLIPLIGLLATTVLSACASPAEPFPSPTPNPNQPVSSDDPTPTFEPTLNPDEYTFEEAPVESVDMVFLESFPLQVHVVASGSLSNGCKSIYDSSVQRQGSTFDVTLTAAVQTGDVACTEALVPFEENIPLDVYGLPAGEYTVNVNGATTSFTFEQDNGPLEAQTPTPAGGVSGDAEIGPASVNDIEVRTEGTASGGPELVIRGAFRDGCTSLHSITDTLDGSTVTVEVLAQRPKDMMCTQALVDFETTYALTSVTQPGTYTVVVNGNITTEFILP
jgi:inhibitor of cysteine peptidase